MSAIAATRVGKSNRRERKAKKTGIIPPIRFPIAGGCRFGFSRNGYLVSDFASFPVRCGNRGRDAAARCRAGPGKRFKHRRIVGSGVGAGGDTRARTCLRTGSRPGRDGSRPGLLADPTTRAIANLFDPAYAAIIAASRLTDFVPPTHVFDPSALTGDVPGPVTPAAPAHGIADYKAAASGEAGQPAGR